MSGCVSVCVWLVWLVACAVWFVLFGGGHCASRLCAQRANDVSSGDRSIYRSPLRFCAQRLYASQAWHLSLKLDPWRLETVHVVHGTPVDKLQALPAMREVLFKNNPIYDDLEPDQQRIEVLKHLPNIAKIDGDMVKPAERDEAAAQLAG